MHKDKGKYHYLVENDKGIFKSIKAFFGNRGEIIKEELACFALEKDAEFLIRDLVDQQNRDWNDHKQNVAKNTKKKKKELVDIAE